MSRTSYYRRRQTGTPARPRGGGEQPRALGEAERAAVLEQLHTPRFVDLAPAEVYATLLDEGRYSAPSARCTASWPRTARCASGAISSGIPPTPTRSCWPAAQRALELGHHQAARPAKWTYFYLYVILDVFSRYVVGWMVAHRESADAGRAAHRARRAHKQSIQPGQLTIHADRGASMTSKPRGVPAGRSGRHQDPQPAACLRRQPVLGKPVQDAEVPAGVPGAVRLHPGYPRLLPGLLPLVQHRAPPQRHRPAHAGGHAGGLAQVRETRPGNV